MSCLYCRKTLDTSQVKTQKKRLLMVRGPDYEHQSLLSTPQ